MNQSIIRSRNVLGPAYVVAEGLYDNGRALALFLDAWSKQGVTPRLNESAARHLRHNLVNAQANLNALRQALAEALDSVPAGEGEAGWQASEVCDEGRVRGRSATPAGSALGGPSGFSGGGGGLL